MPITIRQHSARITIARLASSNAGVIEVRNTGLFTQEVFYKLRPLVFAATQDAPAIVVRLDTAVDFHIEPPQSDASEYPQGCPDQAVIVSDEQFSVWLRHAHNLAQFGVRRAIFTAAHLDLALEWAEASARLRLGRQAPSRDDPVTSGPAPLE